MDGWMAVTWMAFVDGCMFVLEDGKVTVDVTRSHLMHLKYTVTSEPILPTTSALHPIHRPHDLIIQPTNQNGEDTQRQSGD
jgi:hypothetical protein